MAGRFSVEAVFKAVDRITAPVSRMQNKVGKFTRSMNRGLRQVDGTIDRIGSGAKRAALAIVAGITLIAGATADVMKTGAMFEQSLVSAAAKFPGEIRKGTTAFQALEDAARQTGRTTEFTASQSAEALNFLAMAGFNAESSISALPGVVDLATAAQLDLATATDIASDTLGAFGLATDNAIELSENLARVNDVLAKTSTTANATIEQLFESFKEGGPVANTAGASIETFSALAGELANSGIKGTRAGTTLKNMFLKLAAPTAKGAQLLERLGVQTQDADGNFRDIVDVLGDLDSALADLGTAERSGVLEGIFGKIPIAGVNVLLETGAERLREYRTELEGASGASTTLATVIRDTTLGSFRALLSAIESVKISIFKLTEGPLKQHIEGLTEWIRANEDLIATRIGEFLLMIFENFDKIVDVTIKLGKTVGVIVAFVSAVKLATMAVAALNAVMALNPVGLVILGIGALIALLTTLAAWGFNVKEILVDSFLAIGIVVGAMLGPVGLLIAAAAAVIVKWKPIKQFFVDLWERVGRVIDRIQNFNLFGDDEPEMTASADRRNRIPRIISPQERTAMALREVQATNNAEVTIRDETGRAEVTGSSVGASIFLQATGTF